VRLEVGGARRLVLLSSSSSSSSCFPIVPPFLLQHRLSTHYPPHEQLLVRLEVGGARRLILLSSSSSSSCFPIVPPFPLQHRLSTHYPPHEQLLVRLEVGGAHRLVLLSSSSSSSCFPLFVVVLFPLFVVVSLFHRFAPPPSSLSLFHLPPPSLWSRSPSLLVISSPLPRLPPAVSLPRAVSSFLPPSSPSLFGPPPHRLSLFPCGPPVVLAVLLISTPRGRGLRGWGWVVVMASCSPLVVVVFHHSRLS
jgi:hypothetical protein